MTQPFADPIFADERAAEEYRRLMSELASIEPVQLAAVVTERYVFDFLILYESLATSWSFYPFQLHAFVIEPSVERKLSELGIDDIVVHRLPGEPQDWIRNAAMKIEMVEVSGLDRCVVSDVDNVFLSETPELFMLLDGYDFVFVGGPSRVLMIQTHLWSFRRNQQTIAFAREWHASSVTRLASDAAGLPFALLRSRDLGVRVKVLAHLDVEPAEGWLPAPYDVQADVRPFALRSDDLGFREDQMGRVKVLHLSRLRARGNKSVHARVKAMVQLFPQCAPILPHYVKLANRAARRLGIPILDEPEQFLAQELSKAGVLARREELLLMLEARDLRGARAVVGVEIDEFSQYLLEASEDSSVISVCTAGTELSPQGLERLIRFGDRSTVWRTSAASAAQKVAAASLDLVHLDTRNAREPVEQQLAAWYGKVRPGGVLSGEPYLEQDPAQGSSGFGHAVDAFFDEAGLPVRTTYAEDDTPTWYVQIPTSRAQHLEEHMEVVRQKMLREMAKLDVDRAQVRLWKEQLNDLTQELEQIRSESPS